MPRCFQPAQQHRAHGFVGGRLLVLRQTRHQYPARQRGSSDLHCRKEPQRSAQRNDSWFRIAERIGLSLIYLQRTNPQAL
ncbi:MAG: hypothetical protein R6W76_16050 [Caldilinea sp.]